MPSTSSWQSFWGINGFTSDEWYYEHLILDDPTYFQNGGSVPFSIIRFIDGEFRSLELGLRLFNEARSGADTLMNDWAFTKPPITLLDGLQPCPGSITNK